MSPLFAKMNMCQLFVLHVSISNSIPTEPLRKNILTTEHRILANTTTEESRVIMHASFIGRTRPPQLHDRRKEDGVQTEHEPGSSAGTPAGISAGISAGASARTAVRTLKLCCDEF